MIWATGEIHTGYKRNEKGERENSLSFDLMQIQSCRINSLFKTPIEKKVYKEQKTEKTPAEVRNSKTARGKL